MARYDALAVGCGEPSGGRRREPGTVRAPFSRLGLLLDLHVDAFGGERELQALRGGDQANLHPVLIPHDARGGASRHRRSRLCGRVVAVEVGELGQVISPRMLPPW